MIRTLAQLREEIRFRKEHNLPRITLTSEELVEAFGDTTPRDNYDDVLVDRLEQGLPMSLADKRRARAFLRLKRGAVNKLDNARKGEEDRF